MATAVLKLFVGQGSMMDGQRGKYMLSSSGSIKIIKLLLLHYKTPHVVFSF